MATTEAKRQTGARISVEVYRAARVLAAEQDRSIGEVMEEALRAHLKANGREV